MKSRKAAGFIGWTERHATAYALTYAISKRGSQSLRRKLHAEDGYDEHDFEKMPRNMKDMPVSLTPSPSPRGGGQRRESAARLSRQRDPAQCRGWNDLQQTPSRVRIDKWLWGDRAGRSSAFAAGEGATP